MRLGLSAKIIGVFLLVSLLFFPLLTYFTISSSRAVLDHEFIERAKTIARLLDSGITTKESLDDQGRLLSTIQKNIWLQPDILDIDINRPVEGRLVTVASSRVERVGRAATAENVDAYRRDILSHRFLERAEGRTLRIITPIHIAKAQEGTIEIALTLEAVDQKIGELITIALMGYFGFMLAYVMMSRTRFPWTQNWLNRSVQGGPEHDR